MYVRHNQTSQTGKQALSGFRIGKECANPAFNLGSVHTPNLHIEQIELGEDAGRNVSRLRSGRQADSETKRTIVRSYISRQFTFVFLYNKRGRGKFWATD